MKQNEMLLQESLKDRSLRNTQSRTDALQENTLQRSLPRHDKDVDTDARQTLRQATKPKEERPQSHRRTKKIAKSSQESLRPKSSPARRVPQTRRRRDDERSEWVGAVLEGGDMTDVVQLLETIDPMIMQVTTPPYHDHRSLLIHNRNSLPPSALVCWIPSQSCCRKESIQISVFNSSVPSWHPPHPSPPSPITPSPTSREDWTISPLSLPIGESMLRRWRTISLNLYLKSDSSLDKRCVGVNQFVNFKSVNIVHLISILSLPDKQAKQSSSYLPCCPFISCNACS